VAFVPVAMAYRSRPQLQDESEQADAGGSAAG